MMVNLTPIVQSLPTKPTDSKTGETLLSKGKEKKRQVRHYLKKREGGEWGKARGEEEAVGGENKKIAVESFVPRHPFESPSLSSSCHR